MKLKSDIRIKVDKKYHQVYKDLTQNNIGKQVFNSHGCVFVLCATLGFEYNKTSSLESPEQLFWSRSLNNFDTSHSITVLYSIALLNNNEMNYELLSKDEKVIKILEKYASGGMEIIINELLTPYIKENEEGLFLDYSNTTFLEEKMLSYINDKLESSPF